MSAIESLRAAFFPTPLSAKRSAELRAAALNVLSNGRQLAEENRKEYFELYKVMVESSEALVARRQGVNTFFLTINGVLLTAIGLFIQGGGRLQLQAGGISILAVAGSSLCFAWRTLLISFGQLNTGKFIIINAMEEELSAAIYTAEWQALGRGEDPSVYRSFTTRETWVPILLGMTYLLTIIVAGLIWAGLWTP